MRQNKKHNRKAIEWLYQEIPELIEQGIIPAESGNLLRDYYGPAAKEAGSRILMVFSIIGVILVGLGITMLLAHNWDNLSRNARGAIAIGILLFAQLLAGVSLQRKWQKSAWNEGVAAFLMLMVGTSIALIGQTYHVADDTSTFLLTWMLLSVPLVYIMNVLFVAVFYVAGITVWSFNVYVGSGEVHFIWLLFCLILPYYQRLLKIKKYSNSTVLFSWVLIVGVLLAFGESFSNYITGLWLLDYNLVFAIAFLIGSIWFDDAVSMGRRPFKLVGLLGMLATMYLATFSFTTYYFTVKLQTLCVTAGLLVIYTVLFGWSFWNKNNRIITFGVSPLVLGIGFLLKYIVPEWPALVVISNAALLISGIMSIIDGAGQGKIGKLNFGMLLIILQIMTRFMDYDVSFIIRGVVFIIVGILFLLANCFIAYRKRRENSDHEE